MYLLFRKFSSVIKDYSHYFNGICCFAPGAIVSNIILFYGKISTVLYYRGFVLRVTCKFIFSRRQGHTSILKFKFTMQIIDQKLFSSSNSFLTKSLRLYLGKILVRNWTTDLGIDRHVCYLIITLTTYRISPFCDKPTVTNKFVHWVLASWLSTFDY